jgi:hypothetical protein
MHRGLVDTNLFMLPPAAKSYRADGRHHLCQVLLDRNAVALGVKPSEARMYF